MSYYNRDEEIKIARNIQYKFDPIFGKRWSPRSYTGESIDDDVFRAVVDAARLSPSSSNSQPWRIIYAHRETAEWQQLFDLLVSGNQAWAKNCAILILFLSKKLDDKGKDSGTQSFDTGAFWASMALEASNRNLPLHGMAGFDYEQAKKIFNLGDNYKVEAMATMGVPGFIKGVSDPKFESEKPNTRKTIDELIAKANQASDLLA